MHTTMHKTKNKDIKLSATAQTYQTGKTSKVKVALLICIFSMVSNNLDSFYTKKRCTLETSGPFSDLLIPGKLFFKCKDKFSISERTTLNFAEIIEVFQTEYL